MSEDSEVATEEVTLLELINGCVEDRETELMRCFPAQVQSYNASKQTVDVVPALSKHLRDGAGNWTPEALPKLADVPVCFPRCGAFGISLPIQANDWVLVVCAQKNLGNWRSTGQGGDPGDLGMNTLDGAIAIPGVFPDSGALQSASSSNMVMGKDGTPAAQIVITPSQVQLGGGSDFVALAQKVLSELDKIQTAHNTHVHVLTLSSGTGTAASPAIQYTPASVAAANVKAT